MICTFYESYFKQKIFPDDKKNISFSITNLFFSELHSVKLKLIMKTPKNMKLPEFKQGV